MTKHGATEEAIHAIGELLAPFRWDTQRNILSAMLATRGGDSDSIPRALVENLRDGLSEYRLNWGPQQLRHDDSRPSAPAVFAMFRKDFNDRIAAVLAGEMPWPEGQGAKAITKPFFDGVEKDLMEAVPASNGEHTGEAKDLAYENVVGETYTKGPRTWTAEELAELLKEIEAAVIKLWHNPIVSQKPFIEHVIDAVRHEFYLATGFKAWMVPGMVIRKMMEEPADRGHTCAPMPKRSNPYTGEEPVQYMTIKQELSARFMASYIAAEAKGSDSDIRTEEEMRAAWGCIAADALFDAWKERGWA